MADKYLYEYAVIRVVPKVEREEFINVGIIMFSKQARYIKARYEVDENKLKLFSSEIDMDILYASLDSFTKICSGDKAGGRVAEYDIPERFRFLTAVRSTAIQTSRPHSGFSSNLDKTFEQLFNEQVR